MEQHGYRICKCFVFYFFMVMKLKIPSMLDTFSTKSSIPGSGFASVGTARRFSSIGAISIFLWADDYSTCLTDCLTLGTVSFHFNFSNGCTETSHNGFYEHFPDNNNNIKQGPVRFSCVLTTLDMLIFVKKKKVHFFLCPLTKLVCLSNPYLGPPCMS